MSGRGTRAIELLEAAGVPYRVHEYETDGAAGRHAYGLEAAVALGVPADRILKTLITLADGHPAVAVIPVAAELDLKRLAGVLRARRAVLAPAAEAQRLTGYVVGGISPLGQRRRLPTVIDAAAFRHETILVSAGRRGLQVELAPPVLADVLEATVAAVARET